MLRAVAAVAARAAAVPPLPPLADASAYRMAASRRSSRRRRRRTHSLTGTSTPPSGDAHTYWKPDDHPGATAAGGPCHNDTALVLMPIHVLPVHTCPGHGGDKYRWPSAAEAEAACVAHGCDGLANVSMLDSPWHAYAHQFDNGKPTETTGYCWASWYVNDLGLPPDGGGAAEAHVKAWRVLQAAPGCGVAGFNTWGQTKAATGCIGCPRYLQTCPSPPPSTPPSPPP